MGRLGRLGRSALPGRGGRTGRGFKVESWLPIEAVSASELRGFKVTTSDCAYHGKGGRLRSLFLGRFVSRLALKSLRRRQKNERLMAGMLVGMGQVCRGAQHQIRELGIAANLVALYVRVGA